MNKKTGETTMKKITKQNKKYELVYGMDQINGLFMRVFELNKDEPIFNRNCLSEGALERFAYDYGFRIKVDAYKINE